MINPFKWIRTLITAFIVILLCVGWLWWNGYLTTEEVVDGSTVAKEQVIDGFTTLKGYIPADAGDKTQAVAECVINNTWSNLSDKAKTSIAQGSVDGISFGDGKNLTIETGKCLVNIVGK